jgi:hypothetical protein
MLDSIGIERDSQLRSEVMSEVAITCHLTFQQIVTYAILVLITLSAYLWVSCFHAANQSSAIEDCIPSKVASVEQLVGLSVFRLPENDGFLRLVKAVASIVSRSAGDRNSTLPNWQRLDPKSIIFQSEVASRVGRAMMDIGLSNEPFATAIEITLNGKQVRFDTPADLIVNIIVFRAFNGGGTLSKIDWPIQGGADKALERFNSEYRLDDANASPFGIVAPVTFDAKIAKLVRAQWEEFSGKMATIYDAACAHAECERVVDQGYPSLGEFEKKKYDALIGKILSWQKLAA